ncbi:alpha-L-fucosidase [Halosquirtibacter xylanolyticus]|uniref:alpha-L-fucosidase n=1 Tax=Halosquirtibacter xylanolyticus TaxID=3374599 RepID=UPI00374A9873|nr:alpha-L-fucosidase [Prolixibacteraceae bacterium]
MNLSPKALILILSVLLLNSCTKPKSQVPYWLNDYQESYQQSPVEANKQWFKDAKFGMFIHLNLASLCENGRDDYFIWKKGNASDQLLKYVGIDRTTYESSNNKDSLLFQKYSLKNFDADKICQLAKKAKMKYITFTTHHLGGCYNFNTSLSDRNSLNAPCKKDLVQELSIACKKHGIALFMYVPPHISHTNKEEYEHNKKYLTELLTQYGDIAGIWFDGIGGYYRDPSKYTHLHELHQLVKDLQPHALVSFKEGAVGDEDFISPEHFMLPFNYSWDNPGITKRFNIRQKRWNGKQSKLWDKFNATKLREINTVMLECAGRDDTHAGGGWINDDSAIHYTATQVYGWLNYSRATGSNMLMNIGICKDGSIHPDDTKALAQVGEIIEAKGWPEVHNEL